MKHFKTFESFLNEGKHKFSVGDFVIFDGDKARVNKVYTASNGTDMYVIGSSKHGTIEIEAEEVESTNESANVNEAEKEIVMPDTYDIKWTVSDSEAGKGTIAKRFDFEYKINHPDSTLNGEKIKTSVVMAMSDDSTGVFTLGKDVEKFCGIPEKDVKKDVADGKESPDDALIYGLCNIMNGGKDLYFWTNGTRLGGQAKKSGAMPTVMEQLSHEAGVHLTRQVLVKMVAQKLDVNITNDDWITHDYGCGEYCWPAVGDPNDDTPKIIAIDEETFATTCGAMISMLTGEFFKMASKYIPNLPKI